MLEFSEIITQAYNDEEKMAADLAERFPDPLSNAEEIEASFSTAYPNEDTLGIGPSGRGNTTFCVIRTSSLCRLSRTTEIGLDPYFPSPDPRRYPLEKYYDGVDKLFRCLNSRYLHP